jgi:hypothetical protein
MLIASGVVHGIWTDRWSEQTDLADAASKLEQLPMTIGAWHGSAVEMEKAPKTGLAGMMARRYVHATSGKSVTLFMGCGRPGAVCTHTPDVCYAGNGYEVEPPRRFKLPSLAGNAQPEFWTARFVKERAAGKSHLRIFWSWHGSDGWKVADNPRLSFASEKTLYKLYLIRELLQADEPMEGDACAEFMQDLLPIAQKTVFEG